MFRNVHYDMKKSRVYLWETVNGVRLYDIIDWVPYVFVPDKEGYIKTIEGIPVSKMEFCDYQEYSNYQKKHKHEIYENDVPKEIQFLAERYHGIPDEEMEVPALKVYSLDIEVHSERGFPTTAKAEHPIVLINVREFGTNTNISWGIKPYTGKADIEYHYCHNEMELLKSFFSWWNKNAPDVVTGWNVVPNNKVNKRGGFDLPYIVNRSKNLFGVKADAYCDLSPIGVVRTWEDKESGAMNVDIAGVSVLDYLALYKWYTQESPENFKLETVSQLELKEGKLDYSQHKDLRTLFHQDWNTYVEYNEKDNELIEQLDNKLGYIKLAQSLALLCKCRMENYVAATNLVEGLMLTHYRRKGLCAPRLIGGDQEWFPAAYVKDPQAGRYDWVVDLDIASSYPTAIITLNMSPETYYGRLVAYKNDHDNWIEMMVGRDDIDIEEVARQETPITEFVRRREFPVFRLLKDGKESVISGEKLEKINTALQKGLICVAPCGSMFMTSKKGHFASVEKDVFLKRVKVKKLEKDAKRAANATEDAEQKKELKIKAENYFALQWALKIVLNSAYGVTGVPYSRYFNIHISEAITSCGRRAVIDGEKYANRWFRQGMWKKDKDVLLALQTLGGIRNIDIQHDMVAYCDTDSLFIKLGEFFDKVTIWKNPDEQTVINAVLKISSKVEKYVNDCAYNETQVAEYNSQVKKEDFAITFKQEIVCKSALFITKKKYGYHVVNKEHVPCDDIDVTGLEIIRSETPSAFREALRELLTMILKNASDDEIYASYTKYKKLARGSYTEEISENKGVKNLDKYLVNDEPIKGAPYHVKAVGAYHRLIKALKIDDIYPEIPEDSKNKLVYVRPNPYRVECVMYDRWPEEFTTAGVVPDYDKMIDKFFTQKLLMLLEPAKREHILNQNQAFNAFFGG